MTLSGHVDTSNPFVPAVQPGSRLDWDMSKDPFASALFTIQTDSPAATGLRTIAETRFAPIDQLQIPQPGSGANGLFLAHRDLQHPLEVALGDEVIEGVDVGHGASPGGFAH